MILALLLVWKHAYSSLSFSRMKPALRNSSTMMGYMKRMLVLFIPRESEETAMLPDVCEF